MVPISEEFNRIVGPVLVNKLETLIGNREGGIFIFFNDNHQEGKNIPISLQNFIVIR